MAEQKLNIRQTPDNTLFYIDGELQFSSEDEHIYHEMLVHPGAAILNKRISSPWRALILGGGDGLALREILKYRRCAAVDLADHDLEVLEHARTTFAESNCHALEDGRASVFVADAYEYLRQNDASYDLIISDFTFPNKPETARLFTSDFFMRIRERLFDHGIFAMNAVSPSQHLKAFQGISDTLAELRLNPRPMKFTLPSFVRHGYGQWGFFFGSPTMIESSELERWRTKVKTRHIRKQRLLESLNISLEPSDAIIRTPSDMLNLLGVPIPFNVSPMQIDREWVVRLMNILRSMDIERLLDEVCGRRQGLSASLKEQFRILRKELPILLKEQVINIERAHQLLSVLMLIIISVNLLYPDNLYAKGISSSQSSSPGSSIVGLVSHREQTPFHSKILQVGVLAYAVNMHGKTYAKKTMLADKDKADEDSPGGNVNEEDLFYAVTDDIFLTPSGRAYLVPAKFEPYYYRMKPESFTLIREIYSTPIISVMPDNETVLLLLTNLSPQLKAVEKTIADYRKWSNWTSPLKYIIEGIRKESVEIENLEKIRNAIKAAFARFSHYRPVKLPETNPRRIAPGIYRDQDGNTLLWLAENKWSVYPFRGKSEFVHGFPIYEPDENLDNLILKAQDSEPKTFPPFQDEILKMQQMLEKQLLEMNR